MPLVFHLLHPPITAQCRQCVASGSALMAPRTQSPRRGTCCFQSYSPDCTLAPPQTPTATILAADSQLSLHLEINRDLKLLPRQHFETIQDTDPQADTPLFSSSSVFCLSSSISFGVFSLFSCSTSLCRCFNV